MPAGDLEHSPFWYVKLPSEEAAKSIGQRALLTKMLIDVWGEGSTWEELEAALRAYPGEAMAPWVGPEHTFKVAVDTFGSKLAMDDQLDLIEKLEFLPFKGKVRLRNPELTFVLLVVDCEWNDSLVDVALPRRYYFGRQVAAADRGVLESYSLKRRLYLGPTSMDAEIAFIMCNQAKVKRGQLMLDPYAGTGSILVAAAHYGAKVMGTDIDIKVLREGKPGPGGPGSATERVCIGSNFTQYGLPQPVGLIRLDTHKNPIRPDLQEILHAVIGDPPYGVRAGGKKSGAKPEIADKRNPITDPTTHIPATQPYTLGECLRDLLDLSARLLVVGGRLVYFLPATPETYNEAEVPGHPALRLVANSEQMLTLRYSRRLVTMEKVCAYDPAAAAAYHAARPDPTMAIDRLHDIVYEQLDEAAKKEAAEAAPRRRCRGKQF
ncbi:hypothetical protein HXX76_014468 [Chlamydomonas incerta]|uniref:Uncharacterized protein n=1 Tax=Chlamydomonas incerta TaxID=51695 RepID=A0A835SLB4_CHLIN|nr:hypothetical protein HXX76_014468 [Chlamydomonas incerta]|eukprot:KAG2424414.1 hypothetical protein HXX76_014468 [Chlamydomonas incerta]